MRHKGILLLLLLLFSLSGCGADVTDETLSGITYEYGNGSTWGDGFFITITEQEIVTLRCFMDGEEIMASNIPIPPEAWEMIAHTVIDLAPEKDRSLPWEPPGKLDGGDYRILTLTLETKSGMKDTVCKWPADGDLLEQQLKELAYQSIWEE